MRILHIMPHMGGGAGNIISAVSIDSKYEHHVLCLEETMDSKYIEHCRKHGIPVYIKGDNAFKQGINFLESFDIIQIEWWGHPKMIEFLVKELENINSRVVVWSHITGNLYPNIPVAFIASVEAFVFTSFCSFDNKYWDEEQKKNVTEKAKVVASCANNFEEFTTEKTASNDLRLGYLGHLGKDKIHDEYVKFCQESLVDTNVKIKIGGELSYAKELQEDILKYGMENRIELKGFIHDVKEFLSGVDLFLYILQPFHTGTTENALLESMAAGCVPIVLNQACERYIVKHMETGIVIDDLGQCGSYIKWLQENRTEMRKIAKKAHEYVLENFSLKKTVTCMDSIYEETMLKDKCNHSFQQIFGKTPYQWFKSGYRGCLENIEGLAAGENKGSVKQFYRYFPEDIELKRLVKQINSREL